MPNTMQITDSTSAADYAKAVRKTLAGRALTNRTHLRVIFEPYSSWLRLAYDHDHPGNVYEWMRDETFLQVGQSKDDEGRVETRADMYARLGRRIELIVSEITGMLEGLKQAA